MIKEKRVNSITVDFETIRLCRENSDFYKSVLSDNLFSGASVKAIGHSIVKSFFDVCEAALKVLWELKSSPNGTLPWIKMKDIRSKGREYGIATLAVFLKYVAYFLEWIIGAIEEELKNHEGEARDALEVLFDLKRIASCCEDLSIHIMRAENYMREREYFDTKEYFLLIPNEDGRSEEELDRIYAPRSSNSRKSLLPAYIINILKSESNKENPLIQKEIRELIKFKYELEVDRKAVGRCLATLVDDDLNVWTDENRTGYWYSEERPDWE